MRAFVFVVGAAFLASGCFGACGDMAAEKLTELAVEKATGVEVDNDGTTVRIKGKDGEVVELKGEGDEGSFTFKSKEGEMKFGGESKLPDGFPLAVLDGSKVQASAAMARDDESTWMATLLASGELAAATAFYEAELKGKGFQIERHEMEIDGRKMVSLGGTADSGDASVALSQSEEGIFTQISIRQKK